MQQQRPNDVSYCPDIEHPTGAEPSEGAVLAPARLDLNMPAGMDHAASGELLREIADFCLLLAADGSISDLTVHTQDAVTALSSDWIGRDWRESVTPDSRVRAEALLSEAHAEPGQVAIGDVSHALNDGTEMLVRYRALRPADSEHVILIGEDMRSEANLRQQLMNAQQALELDYWRLRQIETRYRRLFDMVSDAILVVDGESMRITEANARATQLLTSDQETIAGQPFPLGLDRKAERNVRSALEEARVSGRATATDVTTLDGERTLDIGVSFLKQGDESRFLLRISDTAGGAYNQGAGTPSEAILQESLPIAPDAILITDPDGRIITANRKFLELAQVVSEDQVAGQLADRWLGRSGVDLSVLLTNLRRNDSVKLFGTTLHGEQGSIADVEISAAGLSSSSGQCLAFFIRDVGRRVAVEHPTAAKLPRSIEQITKRVGRVPLKDLVRESTDVIEALCIEAALELTHDNRASAAELLGLSRQSLYAKLRRYNIGAAGEDVE
ncbi:MAG: transcriptional regulator PpsR [Halieaceae bacterium]|jgi:transcriptional regulator PpsR|nr:transcriptional regulator PpsR [Halieaceae bacterium]